jgi:two-component system, cell cycle response regulator
VSSARGHLLVVDDDRLNRMVLTRALNEQGYTVQSAENGTRALEMLDHESSRAFDVVLLDVLMPELDGYQTLARIKQREDLRHVPVIMISAVDEVESAIRCIKMGATDYLTKPFNAALLHARISASLAGKRLRDLELDYLEQVARVTAAASAVESGGFDPASLNGVAARGDALGQLARVFQAMAHEVRAREERLRQELRELRIEIDQQRQAERVAEITETEYFQQLRAQAADLRRLLDT